MSFDLPPLPYAFDALEPFIDAETMRLHHDGHHRSYVDALNAAIADQPQLQGKSIEEILRAPDEIPGAIRATVFDNGGGHANHQFFWKVVQPGGEKLPSGDLAVAIDEAFGSFDAFKAKFEEAGTKRFGSGWVFLSTNPGGRGLEILALPNQDSVLPLKKAGLLCCDVWEHAYYLTYRNRRADYLKAFWNVVNWTTIGKRLEAMRTGDVAALGGAAR